MPRSELSEQNYKRISVINWVLSIPLIILFAWPYLYLSRILDIVYMLAYPGSLLFSLSLMITILHGHVTMALGSAHRDHYYEWLSDHPMTYGLFFHRTTVKTRFRLILLAGSLLLLPIGYFLKV